MADKVFVIDEEYRMKVINFLKIYGYYNGILSNNDILKKYVSGELKIDDIIKNKKDFKELKIDDIDAYKVINIDVNEDNSNEAFERFIDIYNERKNYGNIQM